MGRATTVRMNQLPFWKAVTRILWAIRLSPVAAHQINIKLNPGEEKTVDFHAGLCRISDNEKFTPDGKMNLSKVAEMQTPFRFAAESHRGFKRIARLLGQITGGLSGENPTTPRIDRIVNIWNQYQCMVTFNMSRSASYFESGIGRGMGFRDSSQDLLALCIRYSGTSPRTPAGICRTQLRWRSLSPSISRSPSAAITKSAQFL
jgi:cellobiose phosphorylase